VTIQVWECEHGVNPMIDAIDERWMDGMHSHSPSLLSELQKSHVQINEDNDTRYY
jgi:hypothetical protein